MHTYKFRAETAWDIVELQKHLPLLKIKNISWTRPHTEFPYAEATLTIDLSIVEVRECMRKVTDGHRMIQTLMPLEEYTGAIKMNL